MYHIILGSENGFLHNLVLFSFFDNINNNKLHRHNTTELNLFQKKGGIEVLLFLGEKKGTLKSELSLCSPELK